MSDPMSRSAALGYLASTVELLIGDRCVSLAEADEERAEFRAALLALGVTDAELAGEGIQ